MCTTGSRFSSATSSARTILRVVIGYQAPPFSEESLAITITSRPLTTPTPVTSSACGASPS